MSELTPQEVLEDLLGSADFPVVIADTRAAAWIILRRLFDAGFEVVPSSYPGRQRSHVRRPDSFPAVICLGPAACQSFD
jgi:hypothetical protein